MIELNICNVINNSYFSNNRQNFECLKVVISADDSFLEDVRQKAELINNRLNSFSASSGIIRSDETVTADNLLGLIAEYACYEVLQNELGCQNVIKPQSNSSYNQIDIQLSSGDTIEVRSSCIRNGLEFALFSVNRTTNRQYIDVIGPYYNNAYKSYENTKDFYMRVIYIGETASIFSHILAGEEIVLYITGGATKEMLSEIGYRKYMTSPADSRAKKKGNYLVVQMSDSFDYSEFIAQLESAL